MVANGGDFDACGPTEALCTAIARSTEGKQGIIRQRPCEPALSPVCYQESGAFTCMSTAGRCDFDRQQLLFNKFVPDDSRVTPCQPWVDFRQEP